jgi:hypothetical protein
VEEDLQRPEDDSEEVAAWFDTQTDPEIARAVAKAEAEARAPVEGAIEPPPRYAPLSQQQQPPSAYSQQPPPPPRNDGGGAHSL